MSNKILLALSGGMDSTTLLGLAKARAYQVVCVAFYYGSKHGRYEIEAASAIAQHYDTPLRLIDLSHIMSNLDSSLTRKGRDVPEGHSESEQMRQTVVPGRNSIFTSILTAIAESEKIEEVWLGIHSGDHFIYPDCRPQWFYSMREVVQLSSERKVTLSAPFLYMNKTSIIKQGLEIEVPYHLTRTCYKDQSIACGKCGSCQERLEAFQANRINDPLSYESRELISK